MKLLFVLGAMFQSAFGYYHMTADGNGMRIVSDDPTCNRGRLEFYAGSSWGSFGDCYASVGTFSSVDATDVCQSFGFDDAFSLGYEQGYGNFRQNSATMFPNSTGVAYDYISTCFGEGSVCKNCSLSMRNDCPPSMVTVRNTYEIYIDYCRRCPTGAYKTSSCTGWNNVSRYLTTRPCYSTTGTGAVALSSSGSDCAGQYDGLSGLGAALVAVATWLIIMIVVLSVCCLIIIIAICACVFGGVACCAAAASSPATM